MLRRGDLAALRVQAMHVAIAEVVGQDVDDVRVLGGSATAAGGIVSARTNSIARQVAGLRNVVMQGFLGGKSRQVSPDPIMAENGLQPSTPYQASRRENRFVG